MKKLVVVGTGAMAKDVKGFVEHYGLYDIAGYACSEEFVEKGKREMQDERVCSIEKMEQVYDKNEVELIIAISHFQMLNRVRKDIFDQLKSNGWKFAILISPTATNYSKSIGMGSWIMDGVYIGNETVIGENTIISNNAYISHYNNIGSHIYISGCSMLMGTVNIGDQCFVGGRATVFNNVTVGKKCIIGGATIVKRDVPDFTVVKLPNDIAIYKQYPEEVIETKLMPPQTLKK